MKRRIVIIGLDGVPFGLLKDLSVTGVMPYTQELISEGIFREMESSIPEISPVAWSSIITGANPAEHGIFGFTDLFPRTYNLKFPNYNDLQRPPLWYLIEGSSIIINVPSTYPVRVMNGVHISGFVSVDLERSVYPVSLLPKLKELDYRLDVDSELGHKSMELFLSDLDKNFQAIVQTYRHLWDSQTWQLFMLVFTGTDRLLHFLWEAYTNRGHSYHYDLLDHFHKIDEVIGEIKARTDSEDLLILLSDHGFERLDQEVYLNSLLKREGFLRLASNTKKDYLDIDPSTKAFALDPARIYINLSDKYPNGSVKPEDRERVLRDLEALFNSLELNNQKVIRNVYRREEIYSGPLLEEAPDLILVANPGFNLRAGFDAEGLTDKGIFTGKHSQFDAFILINSRLFEDILPQRINVCDVVKIVKRWI